MNYVEGSHSCPDHDGDDHDDDDDAHDDNDDDYDDYDNEKTRADA